MALVGVRVQKTCTYVCWTLGWLGSTETATPTIFGGGEGVVEVRLIEGFTGVVAAVVGDVGQTGASANSA